MRETVRNSSPRLTNAEKFTVRSEMIDLLRAELVGPCGGEDESLRERPDKRYLMGMLFPRNAVAGQVVHEEVSSAETDNGADTDDESGIDSPTDLMFQRLPASVGFSFAVAQQGHITLDVCASAFGYTQEADPQQPKKRIWQRRPLTPDGTETVRVNLDGTEPFRDTVLNGRASLYCVLRPGPAGSRIVTISLVNEATVSEGERFTPEQCLFQIRLEASVPIPVSAWPTPDRLFNDPEDDELVLQYRNRPPIAVGHGCAADWNFHTQGGATIRAEFLPAVEVPPVTADIEGLHELSRQCLSLQYVQSDQTPDGHLLESLASFVDEYARWRYSLNNLKTPASSDVTRIRILERIDTALGRMRRGVTLLRNNPEALNCFRLANRAMLVQMVYASRVAAAEKGDKATISPVDPDSTDFSGLRWRPFQLAFQLLSLKGLWAPNDSERDIVDLIWFPTGGGKTEAYLAVAAFEMLRRRLCEGEAGLGTTVLMRYTLRLLTQQQFQRAGHLICALEMLRRKDVNRLGGEPFSLGLWVGNNVTPGSAANAHAIYNKELCQQVGAVSNPFTLLRCPCCGTRIVPHQLEEQGALNCGIVSTQNDFRFFCPDAECAFHSHIPVQIVDEILYSSPPSILLGTLDKFAMIAWREEAGRFFGRRTKREKSVAAPSLIIQDELHLISGPLGTIAGLYEAAIDVTIAATGAKPKVIASTATTRRVSEQGQALYAREVEVFPPAGLDAGESFYSTVVEGGGPGRLYVGAMAQGHTPTFSNVLVSAALLSIIPRLGLSAEIEDGWWTLVAYHNSRRELGRSLTLARDDIPARIAAVYGRSGPGRRAVNRVEELSANVKGEEIPQVLEALGRPKTMGNVVDYLGCTNMLSVGVDVSRLGLMLVLGQPKTASEYIQATSRVGRDSRQLPGVVLSLYMPTKPRDRSHYEMFRPFHEAMYRHVEPSSVTPYALPARKRALHASIISAIRMTTDLSSNDSASAFTSSNPQVRQLLNRLYERMRAADQSERIGIAQAASEIEDWWGALASPGLRYTTAQNARNYRALLKRYGEEGHAEARETLQSMRHVDISVRTKIVGLKATERKTR
ncbi:helicase [Acetobacter cibinongensis NRIC 0482]|nr:helicase [Acetobacter cibinongensis NRIC 0482]